jgi:hypothetical protein
MGTLVTKWSFAEAVMKAALGLGALGQRLSQASSFEDLARGAVEVCAKVAGAQICTLRRVYVPTKVEISVDLGVIPFHFPTTRSEQVWVEVILFNLIRSTLTTKMRS